MGQTNETVTVTADTSLINFESQSLEGGVSPETLQSFPLTVSGAPRSSVAVAIMMPGVTSAGGGNAFNARINGGIITGDEALVDGATTIEGFMNQSGMVALQTDFGMSPDITSEVKVLTANYDAQYGDTTSGQLIITTKSGGEQFHGAAYEYLRNDMFNAFQYGASGKKPPDKENDYGANIGGPILLPKMHGPDSFFKGYFYFNWEGFQDHGSANSPTLSIASDKARNGDFSGVGFSALLSRRPGEVWSAGRTAHPGQPDRSPVPGSDCASLDRKEPTPTNGGEINNYFVPKSGQGSLTNSENVYFWRVDMNVGQKDHFYYTYWWQYAGVNTGSDLPIALSTASPANPENAPIQRLNWERNFSPVMTNHLTLGYLNRNEGYYALNGQAQLPTVSGVAIPGRLPQMNFGSFYSQLGNSATPTPTTTTRGTYALNDVFTRVFGRHTFKAGFEYHMAGTTIHVAGNEGGTYTFNADTTGNLNCPATAACPGDPMASFYLGAVGGASVAYNNVHAEYPRQYAYAAHGGDAWRVTPKLTLNYSVRWDYISPFKEKYNNLSFIDPIGANPGAGNRPGRLAFAGNKWGEASYGKDYPEIPFKSAIAPRVGFAYTIDNKTVVRAGTASITARRSIPAGMAA